MSSVFYHADGGHLILNVLSGPPCIGGFRLFSRNSLSGVVTQLFAAEPNLIHDQLVDNLPLPFSINTIQHIELRIIGRYGPLPNHMQVGVRYMFVQDGETLMITPDNSNVILQNHTPPPPFKEFIHDFNFEPIS